MRKNEDGPFRAYRTLMSAYGPRGWWPTTSPGSSMPVYRPGVFSRPGEREKFEICTGAILTQNTAWKNVEKALGQLHGALALNPAAIATMDEARLADLVRPSGYYHQKARRIREFAGYLRSRYSGKLTLFFDRPRDIVRRELLSLHGIGPETADSMLLYAGDILSFVVDAYTLRIGARLGWFGRMNYAAVQRFLEERLPGSLEVYNEFHALIVELAKRHCRTKPLCDGCPLRERCGFEKFGHERAQRRRGAGVSHG